MDGAMSLVVRSQVFVRIVATKRARFSVGSWEGREEVGLSGPESEARRVWRVAPGGWGKTRNARSSSVSSVNVRKVHDPV